MFRRVAFLSISAAGTEDESIKTEPGSKATGGGGGDHKSANHSEGFSIFHVDFERVEIPFIIGVWILSASIAKIGE